MNLFDIVIPLGPNDIRVINQQIEYTLKNIVGYRNVYIIFKDDSLIVNGCITIEESIFPFSMDTVACHHGKLSRNGWYLQQLIKLYAGISIPGILERYLVVDADTFFLKPTLFIENDKCLYNYGMEYHLPYFTHMTRLNSQFTKQDRKSGICHHMMFETKFVREMMNMVESVHHDVFYNVFLKQVTDYANSGASEYELYFNYISQFHPNEIIIRTLKWKNTNMLDTHDDYDYVSYHWYMR
jgi:hypothetical protein